MSIAAAFAGAIAAFVAQAGESVTYTPRGGEAATVTAAVKLLGERPPEWMQDRYEFDLASHATVTLVADSLAAEPGRGDTVADAGGSVWEVQAVRMIGPGSSPSGFELACTRLEGVEV